MRNQGLNYYLPRTSNLDNKAARQFIQGDFDRVDLQVKYKLKMITSRQRKPKTQHVKVEEIGYAKPTNKTSPGA